MKKIILGFCFLFLAASCATGPLKTEKMFLWQAVKGEKTYYLYGTVHLPETAIEIPSRVYRYIEKAHTVYVESDNQTPKDIMEKRMQRYFKKLKKSKKLNRSNLYSELSPTARKNLKYMLDHPDVRAWVLKETGSKNIDWENPEVSMVLYIFYNFALTRDSEMNQVLPYLMISTLNYNYTNSKHFTGDEKNPIMDRVLESYAKKKKLKMKYLDSNETLENVFNTLYGENLHKMMVGSIEDSFGDGEKVAAQIEAYEEISEAYASGNEDKIEKAIFTDEMKNYEKEIFNQRNKNWFKQLISARESGTVFVAAGIGHFLGDNSLIRSFEKKGFQIKRID